MISKEQLHEIMPFATGENLEKFTEPINEAMQKFEINTPLRIAAFIAQIAHESGSFRYVKELATGEAYEGRKDLGNSEKGDGVRFKGRGLIQITGRTNYQLVSKAIGMDFVLSPEKLEWPLYAVESAAWWWKMRGLNELADSQDFQKITKRINGGFNGIAERQAFYARAKQTLGL